MTMRLSILSLGALLALPAAAQDPVPLYPENYKVLTENERVRVVDFRLRKGATEKPHSHPAHVAVFLADARIRFTLPDGQTRIREARTGEIAYSDPTSHASENIGDTDAHGILVELKTPPGSGAAATLVPKDDWITAVTLIHGLAGKEDDLRQHLLSLAAPTRAETGAVAYDLYESPEQQHEFMRYEVWTSRDALEAHKQTPHLKASFEKRRREGWTTQIMVFKKVPE
jgi:quinol monooxygenase YgiN/quercetin dioxygenase-like cupin family protein